MALLNEMREQTPSGLWARGVKLARAKAVVLQSEDTEEVVLRVVLPDAPVPFTVHLWPEDEDWSCNCPSAADACPHSAAAVIAWTLAARDGTPLPSADTLPTQAPPTRQGPHAADRLPAAIGYRITRAGAHWHIRRVAIRPGMEEPILGSLRGLGRARAGPMLTQVHDLEIEEVVQHKWGQPVERHTAAMLLDALAPATDITLDGEPIRTSGQPVVPHVLVDDAKGGGWRLRIVRDSAITEVFHNGSVRCGDTLRPIGTGGLTRTQRERLSKGVHYGPDDVGPLVAEILPTLREKLPVHIRSTSLPEAELGKPRLVLQTQAKGTHLKVRADLVYGDPPIAKIERGELVILGKGRVPLRDPRAEQRLSRHLSEKLGVALGLDRTFPGQSGVAFVDRLGGFNGSVEGGGWRAFKRAPAVTPQVRTQGGFEVDFGGADPSRVMRAWQQGDKLIQTPDGWAPLPQDWLHTHGHLVLDLLAARDPEGELPAHATFDLARLCQVLNHPPPPELEGLAALTDGFEGIPPAELPPGVQATLRAYQQDGYNWLRFLQAAGLGGILADDMGLGKTLQALCALEGRSLVVAPTSVLHNWAAEAQKFRPDLKVATYHGTNRTLDDRADVTLTTYGVLRLDVASLSQIPWDAVVLDEAQAIKNPEAKVAQAAYQLQAKFKLTLTGTPVENRLDELWSQLHFTNPGLMGGRKHFAERHSKPIEMGERGAAADLRARIAPFVLRRMKRDVAPELPPRTDIVLHCRLTEAERIVYDTVRAASQKKLLDQLGQGGNVMAALEALLRLRQAACHSGLIPGQEAEGSSKIALLLDRLDTLTGAGSKALVFSQWTGLLDRVEPHLRQARIPFLRLDGSTRDRGAVVDRFQDPSGPSVFLISLKAGGTGLNLTAADHVFLLDPWWNPAAEDQAADRAHRIGQDKPVIVSRLVAEDTVEERILALQHKKRQIADAALGEADRATGITRDELLALLG